MTLKLQALCKEQCARHLTKRVILALTVLFALSEMKYRLNDGDGDGDGDGDDDDDYDYVQCVDNV